MITTLCRVRGEQQQGKETSGGRDSVYFIPSSADGYITDLHGIYTESDFFGTFSQPTGQPSGADSFTLEDATRIKRYKKLVNMYRSLIRDQIY